MYKKKRKLFTSLISAVPQFGSFYSTGGKNSFKLKEIKEKREVYLVDA